MLKNHPSPPRHVLPIIVMAQFCCTSLWFASNGVMEELIQSFQLLPSALSHLTSAVQFGFISGTLLFALVSIADRYSPSKVFLLSALFGAFFNVLLIWRMNTIVSLIGFRFLTGFFLAGIYPVGMKIASDYYDKKLGISLGYLVGALVLGTASPHLLKSLDIFPSWRYVVYSTSILACMGGLFIFLFVPNGPYRKKSQQIKLSSAFNVFQSKKFRGAAFGYFGHMWELYAFWAFVPVLLSTYQSFHPEYDINIALTSFIIIGIGGLSCIIGGYLSHSYGTGNVAKFALFLSGLCCLVSPLAFMINTPFLFIAFLLFWGMVVIMDSPLFSTLVAQNAPPKLKGTALTIVNCIGFSITIVSIQLLNILSNHWSATYIYCILALGPLLGIYALGQSKFNP
ncbi:MAG: MFS transporter [Saprospiraceae bacterium]|nr:MFS transporter [Saprospiraceae bacterium]